MTSGLCNYIVIIGDCSVADATSLAQISSEAEPALSKSNKKIIVSVIAEDNAKACEYRVFNQSESL